MKLLLTTITNSMNLPVILNKNSIIVVNMSNIDSTKIRTLSGSQNATINYLTRKKNPIVAFAVFAKINMEQDRSVSLKILTPSLESIFEIPIEELNKSFISVLYDPNNPTFIANIAGVNIDLDDTLLNPLVKILDLDVEDLKYEPKINQEDEPEYNDLFKEYQMLLVKYNNLQTVFDLLSKSNIPMIENDYFKELLNTYLKNN